MQVQHTGVVYMIGTGTLWLFSVDQTEFLVVEPYCQDAADTLLSSLHERVGNFVFPPTCAIDIDCTCMVHRRRRADTAAVHVDDGSTSIVSWRGV